MELLSKKTRFRAYQIGTAGSLFSYYDGNNFTLIDANCTEQCEESLEEELTLCNKESIDILHITSWDSDHCLFNGLEKILKYLSPTRIEIPGYNPDTQNGIDSLELIKELNSKAILQKSTPRLKVISPSYISGLNSASSFEYTDILYNPRELFEKHNDNSIIQLFRTGSFTVASLGDAESPEIAKTLIGSPIFQSEIDVMILAHHGADNGFTTPEFIQKCKPKVAVCSSDYSNKHDHPRQEIRDMLYEEGIKLYTTKTGDVIISSIGDHKSKFQVTNLKANSEEVSSQEDYTTKRYSHSVKLKIRQLLSR